MKRFKVTLARGAGMAAPGVYTLESLDAVAALMRQLVLVKGDVMTIEVVDANLP